MSASTRISVAGSAWLVGLALLGPTMSLVGCQQASRPDWEIYAEVMERSPEGVLESHLLGLG